MNCYVKVKKKGILPVALQAAGKAAAEAKKAAEPKSKNAHRREQQNKGPKMLAPQEPVGAPAGAT